MCENAPDLIHEFCTMFVWCEMFDVGCGGFQAQRGSAKPRDGHVIRVPIAHTG